MRPADDDDDVTVDEQLIAGRVTPGDEALAQVLATMRAMAAGPEPRPSAALAALLTADATVLTEAPSAPDRAAVWRRALRWVAGLGVVGKVALGAGVAVAGTTGVATIPAVPDVVQVPVHDALVRVERFIIGEPPQVVVNDPGATPSSGAGDGGASSGTDSGHSTAVPAVPVGGSGAPAPGPGAATAAPGVQGQSATPGSGESANGVQGGRSSQGSDSRSTTAPGGRPTVAPGRPTDRALPSDGAGKPTSPAHPTPSPAATPDSTRSGGGQQGENGTGQGGSDIGG